MKNVKKIVSLVMVVAIVVSLGAVGFASNRFKADVVTDWQYGMLNDLSSGKRTLGQEPALTVTSASTQAKTVTVVPQEIALEAVEVDSVVATVVETVEVKAPAVKTSANPYVNEWQQAILDDLSTGNRRVGQKDPITVYKDSNIVLNPGNNTYDYIAWN